MPLRVAAKAGHKDTRATNRRLVLQSLFRSDGLSRADLARSTGLTPATVSDLVTDLLADGLIETRGRGPAKVGKPSTLLGLNATARSVVCIDLSNSSFLRGAVSNLAGDFSHRVEVGRGEAVGREVLALALKLTSEVIDTAADPILGIGVGSPGVVTPAGVVVEADNLGWYGLDLAGELREEFGLPVSVGNDANIAALAEYSRAESASENLLVVKIAQGVGAGIVLNGQQFFGESFAAGEIGHTVVDDDGPQCRCGKLGCLEAFIAVPRLTAAIDSGEDPSIVVANAGRWLGFALAATVNVLDIHDIVVTGSAIPLQDLLCSSALEVIRKRTLSNLGQAVTIRPSELGNDAILIGANVLVTSQELGVA